MLRVRFHGRGGQGMKTAGRILGSALFREGFHVQDAPRYGAERRGAPIFSFVRAAHAPIRERGSIDRPDLVIVADDTLIADPAAGVLIGLDAHAVLFIVSEEAPATWKERLQVPGTILTLPALAPAERRSGADMSAPCAGVAARLLGVVSEETLVEAIRDELATLGDAAVAAEIAAACDAYAAVEAQAGCVAEAAPAGTEPAVRPPPRWVDMAADPVDIAAPATHKPATSVLMHTGLWRVMRPVIDHSRCRRCIWVCGSFCPDSAIASDAEGFPLIDYDHCKGCLICVAQCPTHAIEAVPEQHHAHSS